MRVVLFDIVKTHLSLYISVHVRLRSCDQIRNVHQSIDSQYSVDVFLKYISIHPRSNQSTSNTKGTLLMPDYTADPAPTPNRKSANVRPDSTHDPSGALLRRRDPAIEDASDLADHGASTGPARCAKSARGSTGPSSSSRPAGPRSGSGSRNSITRGRD